MVIGMTLQNQVVSSMEGLSDDDLLAVLSFVHSLKEKPHNVQSKSKRKKAGYFNNVKFVADDFDFDADNDLIAELFGVK